MNSDHGDQIGTLGDPVGLFYAWWRGDAIPDLSSRPDMAIECVCEHDLILDATGLAAEEIRMRLSDGNAAFIARIEGEVVAFGWSAAGQVAIGELGIHFVLPSGNRYLWDFVTLPAWRGRSIYPVLLQAILIQESDAERYWVGHDLSNVASARGITKAGFQTVGEVHELAGTGPVFVATQGVSEKRARAAAELLGIPLFSPGPNRNGW